MLLVEGGGRVTSAGDIPDHQDVDRVEDKWRAYRNIVKGGFFFNDSVIVLADYSDDENVIEEHVLTIGEKEDSQTKANNVKKTEAFIDLHNDREDTKKSVKVSKDLVASLTSNIMCCRLVLTPPCP